MKKKRWNKVKKEQYARKNNQKIEHKTNFSIKYIDIFENIWS